MAIDPHSDIVLEVARAADPTRLAAVQERLSALASAGAASPAEFAAALRSAESAAPAPAASGADMRARFADGGLMAGQRAHKAEVQFESVLLNSFIGEMLPKDAPDAFGKGVAGDMWRSMLAEKIADQLASGGALGIGRRLFATHPMPAATALGEPAAAGAATRAPPAQSSANALSVRAGAEIGRGSLLFTHGEPI